MDHVYVTLIHLYFPVVSIYGNPSLHRQLSVYLKKLVFATACTQSNVHMKWEDWEQRFSMFSYAVYTATAGSEMSMSSWNFRRNLKDWNETICTGMSKNISHATLPKYKIPTLSPMQNRICFTGHFPFCLWWGHWVSTGLEESFHIPVYWHFLLWEE